MYEYLKWIWYRQEQQQQYEMAYKKISKGISICMPSLKYFISTYKVDKALKSMRTILSTMNVYDHNIKYGI